MSAPTSRTPTLDAFRADCARLTAANYARVQQYWAKAHIRVFEPMRWFAVFFHCHQSDGYYDVCTGLNHPMGYGCQLLRCRFKHVCMCCDRDDHGAFQEEGDKYRCPWMQKVYIEVCLSKPGSSSKDIDARLNAIFDKEQSTNTPAVFRNSAPLPPVTGGGITAGGSTSAARVPAATVGRPASLNLNSVDKVAVAPVTSPSSTRAWTTASGSAAALVSKSNCNKPHTDGAHVPAQDLNVLSSSTAGQKLSTVSEPSLPTVQTVQTTASSLVVEPVIPTPAPELSQPSSSPPPTTYKTHKFGSRTLTVPWIGPRLARVLGHNNLSTVCTGQWKYLPNREIAAAIKIFPFKETDEDAEKQRKEFEAEVESLLRLSSRHVVKILDHSSTFMHRQEQEHCCIVMERLDCNLAQFVQSQETSLTPHHLQHLVIQLLASYDHCHSKLVAHRDVKPENVLVVDSAAQFVDLRLCDFAFAKVLNERTHTKAQAMSTKVGTTQHEVACWFAPEVLAENTYNITADIWPLGVMLLWLSCNGKSPFKSEKQVSECCLQGGQERCKRLLRTSISSDGSFIHEQQPLLFDLVERMVQVDPMSRLAPEVGLTHPFLWNDERLFAFLLQLQRCQQYQKVHNMMTEIDKQDIVPVDWQQRLQDHFEGINPLSRPQSKNMRGAADVVRHLRNIHEHWSASDASHSVHQQHSLELAALADDIRLQLPNLLIALWTGARKIGKLGRADHPPQSQGWFSIDA